MLPMVIFFQAVILWAICTFSFYTFLYFLKQFNFFHYGKKKKKTRHQPHKAAEFLFLSLCWRNQAQLQVPALAVCKRHFPLRSQPQVPRDVASSEAPRDSAGVASTLTAQCRVQWSLFVAWWPQTAPGHPGQPSGSLRTLWTPWMSRCSVSPCQGLSHPPYPDLWASPDLQW